MNSTFAKVIQVIEVVSLRGRWTEENPLRNVTQYFTLDGTLLNERDIEDEQKLARLEWGQNGKSK